MCHDGNHGLTLKVSPSVDDMANYRVTQVYLNCGQPQASELLTKHDVLTCYYDLDPRVLRFEPPLVITREQIDTAVDALDKVLSRGRAALLASCGLTAVRAMAGRRADPAGGSASRTP